MTNNLIIQEMNISMDIFSRKPTDLENIYRKYLASDNPRIQYALGYVYFNNGKYEKAHHHFLLGALNAAGNSHINIDPHFKGAIGLCLSMLLTEYRFDFNASAFKKILFLDYYFLPINDKNRLVGDYLLDHGNCYIYRSLLFHHGSLNNSFKPFNLDLRLLYSMNCLSEPLAIADLYKSFTLDDNHSALTTAQNIHRNLDDISIAGKDASEYSLAELAAVGEKRHEVIFTKIKDKFISNELRVSADDIKAVFNTHETQ